MQAFLNNPEMKDFILSGLAAHRAADQIVQGTYWENGRGCGVGCTLESVRQFRKDAKIDHSSHALYELYLGVPRILAHMEDRLFEGLSKEKAKEWPERFVRAIKPGADLSRVWPKFAAWMLADPKDGAIRFCKTDEQRAMLQKVADTYLAGTTDKATWAKLRDEAWKVRRKADAYAYADPAYADADAAYAAYAYAYAAYDAADAARRLTYERMADKLIELLEAA